MEVELFSWNLLHIMHEINYVGYSSLVLKAYPDESDRLKRIVEYIKNVYDSNERVVINLQEVPGDYLEELTNLFQDNICKYTYPRVPKFKSDLSNHEPVYKVPTESLVSIYKGVQLVGFNATEYESGKAGLSLDCVLSNSQPKNFTVINVHMPWEWKNNLTFDEKQVCFILGDCNKDANGTKKMFLNCEVLPNDKVTWTSWRNNSVQTGILDHVVYQNYNFPESSVLNVHSTVNFSDHFPVSCTVFI
jgi:hypothetical protein